MIADLLPPMRLKNSSYMIMVGMRRDNYELQKYKVDFIIETVCKRFDKTLIELQSQRRDRELVEPRQICMAILKRNTTLTLKEIGNMFGKRDHTTVIHAINHIRDMMKTEAKIRHIFHELEVQIQ
jgi:chromosomal replication initiator protein